MPTRGYELPVIRSIPPNSTSRPFYIYPRNQEIPGCKATEETEYDTLFFVLSMIYMFVGLLQAFFGYRLLKGSLFMTGFNCATVIVYILCIQERLLPPGGNVLVCVLAGVLFGTINLLIEYVGLFVNGLHTGLLVAIAGLAIYDHLLTVYPTTYWLCVVIMGCSSIFFAIINLYWKKGISIFGTALYGSGMISICIDYLYERFGMLEWLWQRASLKVAVPPACKLTWLFLAVWPFLTFVGYIAQWCLTGTGIHHEQSIAEQKRRLQKQQQARPITREQRAELKQKKYRYLYQVRTAHGDVISQYCVQSYVQALQKKAQLNNWGGMAIGGAECSTLQSDSTHLTVLPGSDHHHESDDEMHQIRTVH